jgi:hypothetical protein
VYLPRAIAGDDRRELMRRILPPTRPVPSA